MKKEWINVYAILEKDNKKMSCNDYYSKRGKAFYLSKKANDNSEARIVISRHMSSYISNDMSKLANIIANNIIKGMINNG